MHGEKETSRMPRAVITTLHCAFLIISGWLFFCGGDEIIRGWLGKGEILTPSLSRRIVLFSFGIILFSRMTLTLFYLLKRRFGWDEFTGVLVAVFIYQVVFALLSSAESAGIDILDIIAIIVFLFGSSLNTVSELQRKHFKRKPENQGILYTHGLFRYARHINYTGDILWVLAWAIVTRNAWSIIIPVLLTSMFIFNFIPSLNSYLQSRYGEQFTKWRKETKALIPYIY